MNNKNICSSLITLILISIFAINKSCAVDYNKIKTLDDCIKVLDSITPLKYKTIIKEMDSTQFMEYLGHNKKILHDSVLYITCIPSNDILYLHESDSLQSLKDNLFLYGLNNIFSELHIGRIIRKAFWMFLNNFKFDVRQEVDSINKKQEFGYVNRVAKTIYLDKYLEYYIPKGPFDAFQHLNVIGNDSTIQTFKNLTEYEVVKRLYCLSWARWIPGNNYGRLNNFYFNFGITDIYQMREITAVICHRLLNNKEVKFSELIDFYKLKSIDKKLIKKYLEESDDKETKK